MMCDRCGSTAFLELRCTITQNDFGEYTKNELYDSGEKWGKLDGVGDLCPSCLSEYEGIMKRYLNKDGYHDLAKCRCYDHDRCLGTKEMDPCKGDKCEQWRSL